MKEQAAMLIRTGFLPEAIRTPEQAVAVMLKGRELGIPTMYALSNIAVIKGKPVANAELLLALIYRDHGDNAIRFIRSDAEVCAVEYRRRSWQRPEAYNFSLEDARTAGLLGNQTWQKYPKAMLRARCVSAVARMAFPDSIGGMYTPEELGANVAVSEDEVTAVVDVTPPAGVDRQTGEIIDEPAYGADEVRRVIYRKLNRRIAEAKHLGLDVTNAEAPVMDDEMTNDELIELGKSLAGRINVARQKEDQGAGELFEETEPVAA